MAGPISLAIVHVSLPLALAAAEALFAAQAAAAEIVAVAQYADVGAAEETCEWAPVEAAVGEVAVEMGADGQVGSAGDNWEERMNGAALRCTSASEDEAEMVGTDIEDAVGAGSLGGCRSRVEA